MTSNGLSTNAAGSEGIVAHTTGAKDSIQETKDKAKAIMAASGLDISSAVTDMKRENSAETSSHAEDGAVNGASPSRKRSRSGSRKPKVPRGGELGIYPRETDTDEYRLRLYRERDTDFADRWLIQHKEQELLQDEKNREDAFWKKVRHAAMMNPAEVYGLGFQGYGNGWTEPRDRSHGQPLIIFPQDRWKFIHKRHRNLLPYLNRTDIKDQSNLIEELVPIRLDIEHDKIKLRDTFTWNLHDYITSPEIFADQLVGDFQVPTDASQLVAKQASNKIREQLQEFYPHIFTDEKSLDETLPYFAYKNDEMRILVKLNITIGSVTLVDQFEWDINNTINDAEDFARQMAFDLSLSGEFATAIAHQIREQSQMFTKSLFITSHPFDGRPIEDADVRDGFLPSPINSVFRPVQSAKDYTPYLYELNEADLQREELSILRDQRRQKRSVGRRGGPALPDLKDRERTIRSLVVSSVLPGAAESLEGARLFKLSRSSGRGRRPGGRIDGGEDSDEEESEESEMELEVMPQITTTSRGRTIRGAATVAQVAMRATIGRSATPELSTLHHVDSRSSLRKPVLEVKDDSDSDEASLIVKLRLPRVILRQLAQGVRIDRKAPLSAANTPRNATPSGHTPGPSSSTPKDGVNWVYHEDGRVDAPAQRIGQTPPPPPWLSAALSAMQKKYPHDSFEAQMKLYSVDPQTGAVISVIKPDGGPPPENAKIQYLPRIKCNDCPGKVYNPGQGQTADGFEIHLKNKFHKERVEQRRKNER